MQGNNEYEQETITQEDVGSVSDVLSGGEEQPAAPTDTITDINELELAVGEGEAVDWDALEERMTYAPSIPPGFHAFRFSLDEKTPVQSVIMAGKTCFQINWNGTLINPDSSEGKTVRFNRVNSMRTGKMQSSRVDELIMALSTDRDLVKEYDSKGHTPKVALELAQRAEAEGRILRGKVIWRHFDTATGETLSTSPSKPYKRKDRKTGEMVTVVEKPWPREQDGSLARHPGREEIVSVLPLKVGS